MAAALETPAIGFPLDKFPWAEAMISFARALGAAHTGDLAAAETEVGKLQALRDKAERGEGHVLGQPGRGAAAPGVGGAR